MKIKRILLSLALLLGIAGAKAQQWRGFLEAFAGTSPFQTDIVFKNGSCNDMWNALTFGLNYTMGVAVTPQFYAGVGIGGYTTFIAYREGDNDYFDSTFSNLYFPVFANVRWIPDITKKINPFVDLKIGYQMGMNLDNNDIWTSNYYDENYENYVQYRNGLFLQPGIGIRFGRESAFNLGIAYNVCIPQEFITRNRSQAGAPIIDSIKKSKGDIRITLGADF